MTELRLERVLILQYINVLRVANFCSDQFFVRLRWHVIRARHEYGQSKTSPSCHPR